MAYPQIPTRTTRPAQLPASRGRSDAPSAARADTRPRPRAGQAREPGAARRPGWCQTLATIAAISIAASITLATPASQAATGEAIEVASSLGPLRLEIVAEGLDTPWSLAFLPDGRLLVTERPGRLRIIGTDGALSAPVTGLPRIHARGQGGLLDIALANDFAASGTIFLSYAEPLDGKARTAVLRARLDLDALRLDAPQRIFAQHPAHSGNNHWGSRIVPAPDGTLFVTLGDRFDLREQALDLSTHLGKIVRINPDGSAPADNPFVTESGALPEIYSYGHRNVQGAALHPASGALWAHEHGPRGGDEVNQIRPGGNYGWPRITFGREYVTRARIGEGTSAPDVEPPLWQWTPSIAPSGMSFVTDPRWGAWQGNLLVGALAGQRLVRLAGEADTLHEAERLLDKPSMRIRDVRQAPDGAIYLLDETSGRVLRLQPPGAAPSAPAR